MACGCASACGCEVVGDGATTQVVRSGDKFTVSAIRFIDSVANTDCIELAVASGELTATPIIRATADEGVELECTPEGLHARLRIDPASTAPISVGPLGLRVDCCEEAPELAKHLPGEVIDWPGVLVPTGYIEAFGQEVPRSSYPDLFDALSLYSLTAERQESSPTITGLTTTKYILPGMLVSATGFPVGTTVVSVDSGSQITVSNNASSGGSDTEVRIHVWGTPLDEADNFIVPDLRDRVIAGVGDMGGTAAGLLPGSPQLGVEVGQAAVTLLVSNLPSHSHSASLTGNPSGSTTIDGSGSVPTSSSGSHSHEPSATDRNFVTAESATIQQRRVQENGAGNIDVIVDANDPNADYGQKNNASTNTAGDHTHTVGGSAIASALTASTIVTKGTLDVSIGSTGSGSPVSVVQPTVKMRKIIKT